MAQSTKFTYGTIYQRTHPRGIVPCLRVVSIMYKQVPLYTAVQHTLCVGTVCAALCIGTVFRKREELDDQTV